MHIAASKGNTPYLELLISYKANINRVHLERQRTPLDEAIRKKRQEAIGFLKSKGAKTYEELVASGAKID